MNQEEEKYNSIINWFIGPQGLDQHIPEMLKITSRLSKNFGIFSDDFDFGASRNPVMQYMEEILSLANNLLQISSKIYNTKYTALQLPSSSKETINSRSSQKDVYNWLLSQRVKEFNFILTKIEELIQEKFYKYVGIVKQDYTRDTTGDKKILFQSIEIAESAKRNLKRIEKYILVKYNAPDPELVYSLVKLENLKKYGFLNQTQYDNRTEIILENIITIFVTEGRYLEQEKLIHTMVDDTPLLSKEGEEKLEELSLMFQEGFMEEGEYRSRKEQLYEQYSNQPKANVGIIQLNKPTKGIEVKQAPVRTQTIRQTMSQNDQCPYVGKKEPGWVETQTTKKDFGKQKIEMTVKIMKKITCSGRCILMNLYINNETKKTVNTVNLELQSMTGDVVAKVDDTINEMHSSEHVLPIINKKWNGNILFTAPTGTVKEGDKFGNYKLVVKLIYEAKHNLSVSFGVELVVKHKMLQLYPTMIYDVPLITLCQRDKTNVPKIITYLVSLISNNKNALVEEGIFRKSGSSTRLNEVREKLDGSITVDWDHLLSIDGSVHNISGMLKLFLRYLPDPLFAEHYDEFMEVADIGVPIQRHEKYKLILKKLPPQNYATISYLFTFFRTYILPNEKINKMNASNLSIVFGPSMMWKKNISEVEEMMNFKKVNMVMEELIKDSDKLFS